MIYVIKSFISDHMRISKLLKIDQVVDILL